MAILKPSPSAPMRFSTGTRTPSKMTARVGCTFQPIFFSLAPNESPGASPGMTKVEMPFGPSPPVRTITT